MHVCLAVANWTILLSVVALPLLIFCPSERRARQQFLARRAAEAAEGRGNEQATTADAAKLGLPQLPLTGSWFVDCSIISCLLWDASDWLARRALP